MNKKTITYIATIVILAAAVIFGVVVSESNNRLTRETDAAGPSAAPTQNTDIKVTVTGEVISPGEYRLPEGSTVKDAIDAAGGYGEYADDSYYNPYDVLEKNQKVWIKIDFSKLPEDEEGFKADINLMTEEQMKTALRLADESIAAIVELRAQTQITAFSELKDIPGMTGETLDRLRALLDLK